MTRIVGSRLVATLATAAAATALAGQQCTVRSGPLKNPLVELYTSEGCSSCPPADRWLSSLAPAAMQPQLVPIAFHVSYWDDLGWKDVYASSRYTERQRALAVAAGRANVYTPQVMLDGRDYPAWHGAGTAAAIAAVAQQRAPATLELAQAREGDALSARVRVDLPPQVATPSLELVVALTEDHLGSRVTAGENRGATLRHDHVVRDFASFPLSNGREFTARFMPTPAVKPADARIVAFVQDRRTGVVLQALSGCAGS